ncbi:MAG TPA: hypothetical protein VGL89_04315 [Candidatus Koribacter sp.]|jgi:hypothetical protein
MLALGWLFAFLAACLIVMVLPAVAWFEIRRAYSGKRNVICPELKDSAEVELDAGLAARSRFCSHASTAKVAHCSHWPMKEGCAEDCIPEVLMQNKGDTFSVNHVGVLIAGLVGGAFGDLLRCSPFAREWMASVGFPALLFSRKISYLAPAVFDVVAMIIVAYVLTWLMHHVKVAGVRGGLEVAALLWLGVVCLSIPEVVFFFPVKIFAMSALLKLCVLLVQGLLLGIFVVSHPKSAGAAISA